MAYFYNTFEGGIDGQNISVANSGGASGNPWGHVFINGASAPAGGDNIKYSSAAAFNGSMGCAIVAGAVNNYLRWNDAAGGTRGVVRCPIKMDSAITNLYVGAVAGIYNTTSRVGAICVRGTGTGYRISAMNALSADPAASRWTATLGVLYWAELAITKGTTTSDGVLELKVFATDGVTELWSWASTAENTGTANVDHARFISTAEAPLVLDDLQFDSDKPSGWLGPLILSNNPPTVSISPSTQNLAISTTANLSASASDSDGTIASHAWTFDYPTSGAPSFTGGSTATPSFTTGSTVGSLYVARDTVTDNGGATAFDTAEVRVPTGSAATALSGYAPAGTAWNIAGGAADEGAALSDGSGTTYVESPDITSTPVEHRWRIQPMTIRTGYRFTLLGVSITSSSSHSSKVRVYQGSTLITERATTTLKRVSDNATTDLTTTPTDLYFDLTSGEVAAITDSGDLWLAMETVL